MKELKRPDTISGLFCLEVERMILKPKSDETWGECLFEQMAALNNLAFKKIKEGSEKSVDYEVTIDGRDILFEISDFVDGTSYYGHKSRYEMEEPQSISSTVGLRLSKKIKDKREQVSSYVSVVKKPCILLVFNRDGFFDSDNNDIISSILGNRTLSISRKTGKVTDDFFDGKSVLKANRNTSFSAIGNIYTPTSNKICSDIYSNPWAKYPLKEDIFDRCKTIYYEEIKINA